MKDRLLTFKISDESIFTLEIETCATYQLLLSKAGGLVLKRLSIDARTEPETRYRIEKFILDKFDVFTKHFHTFELANSKLILERPTEADLLKFVEKMQGISQLEHERDYYLYLLQNFATRYQKKLSTYYRPSFLISAGSHLSANVYNLVTDQNATSEIEKIDMVTAQSYINEIVANAKRDPDSRSAECWRETVPLHCIDAEAGNKLKLR